MKQSWCMTRADERRKSEKDKLLIIHADDLGMAHSINCATFEAFRAGAISSASVMVACPWFPEVIRFAAQHPEFDLGVHLTLTSEWPGYKWRPLLGQELPALLDPSGFFPTSENLDRVPPPRVASELRAQIRSAMASGMNPTHVDTHMFALFSRPETIAIYIAAAREFGLPFHIPTSVADNPGVRHLLQGNDIAVNTFIASADFSPADWKDHYLEFLRRMKPGLNQLIVHLGYDDGELRAVTAGNEAWGSAWRQRDFDVVMSPEFRSAREELGIQTVDWGQLSVISPGGDTREDENSARPQS